jgi:hypothetical protein
MGVVKKQRGGVGENNSVNVDTDSVRVLQKNKKQFQDKESMKGTREARNEHKAGARRRSKQPRVRDEKGRVDCFFNVEAKKPKKEKRSEEQGKKHDHNVSRSI